LAVAPSICLPSRDYRQAKVGAGAQAALIGGGVTRHTGLAEEDM
jgi:hypothetical protein